MSVGKKWMLNGLVSTNCTTCGIMTLSVMVECYYAECHLAEWRYAERLNAIAAHKSHGSWIRKSPLMVSSSKDGLLNRVSDTSFSCATTLSLMIVSIATLSIRINKTRHSAQYWHCYAEEHCYAECLIHGLNGDCHGAHFLHNLWIDPIS